ncbi:unnamed protein product [Paramecium octaurelia]|uniref:Uncharacterized protein n=1 Tax=Paramecium octaurelia TaxID=43137 RepID=A0A8S1WM32_PAROT|nr:unnamed protein product [Paramecium octaurelia]
MNHSLQNLIESLKQSLEYFECTYKYLMNSMKKCTLVKRLYPRKNIVPLLFQKVPDLGLIAIASLQHSIASQYCFNSCKTIPNRNFLINNQKYEIDKELLNEYINYYVQKFEISQYTHQNLNKFNLRMISRLPRQLIKSVSFIIQDRKNKTRWSCMQQ